MSSAIHSAGTSSTPTTLSRHRPQTLSATTRSTGSWMMSPPLAMSSRAVSSASASTRLLPMFVALRGQEGVGHAAADENDVDLGQQVGDDADLVADLGAAQNGHEGAHRVFQRAAEEGQLLLHQEAGDGRQVVGDAFGAGMGAMRAAKGIVDVDIAQLGQLLRPCRRRSSSRACRSACFRARAPRRA